MSVFSKHTRGLLKPGAKLEYTKLQHANLNHYHGSVVNAVEFHPKEEGLLATAGLDRKVQLFSVSRSRPSQKVQTILLPDLPVYQARFIKEGHQLLITGNRKYFYYYDLASNKLEKVHGVTGGAFSNTGGDHLTSLTRLFTPPSADADMFAFAGGESGSISVMSQSTKKMLFELKLSSSSCTAVGFSEGSDPRYMYAVGDQAEIYMWDIRHTRKCLAKIGDEGSFNTTHLTVSPDGSQLATGSHSGVINLYKTEPSSQDKPLTLMKSILNLTTAITDLKFDPTS
jgi:U3 small nucleolar RNA-associated protein 18